ncbi:hypothetical protein F2Q69_00024462 [Brassica cretica]|uniref:Uncharacterized protein n=1 Tax=Brassica cretica TaxID=69181 RepID=A0A8S9QHT5_BRACR|nr:hypothetical protein F2Q69_00024462 [Brassica cretica]
MIFSIVTSISNKDFASRFQLMGMHRHIEQRVDFMDWSPDFLTYAEPVTVALLLKFSNSGAVLNICYMKIRSILSKEDSFRSLSSNDDLEGYKEDVRATEGNAHSPVPAKERTLTIKQRQVKHGLHF